MSLDDRIPNNVDLSSDRRLQKALEKWQPHFQQWWQEMGPEGFQASEVYLRTAVSVEPGGWAHFEHVKMPDYRWGIFLAPEERDRSVAFGDEGHTSSFDEVPGEFRNSLRRLIVTQGDTEPASVEQQRLLGQTCPSHYDLRNLFQVNVEEGRHLWAMVYLLHRYFGRDGREEADALLERRSGNADKPRILEAFNQPIEDWLSFYCFTMFVDRDGKYQLGALAESCFSPLRRSCQFMLTEEAHHLFVGEMGLDRVVQRSAELTLEGQGDPRPLGGIPLEVVQKYVNFWFSHALDLFGGEISSNAADFFAAGLKGRWHESKKYDDHTANEDYVEVPVVEEGRISIRQVPSRNAMNEILRSEYVSDCERALERWNKTLAKAGVDFRLSLPNRRWNRHIGEYAGQPIGLDGTLHADRAAHEAERVAALPTENDRNYVKSLMKPVTGHDQMANWIAPPSKGINGNPWAWEYVRFN